MKGNNIQHIFTYDRLDLSFAHLVTNYFTELVSFCAIHSYQDCSCFLIQTETCQTVSTLTSPAAQKERDVQSTAASAKRNPHSVLILRVLEL